jgi:agmatine deiminase
MPAEWERHEATWLAWPHNATDWPRKISTIRWAYGEMIRKISPGEIIRLFVNSTAAEAAARRTLTQAHADVARVQFILHPTNRGWMRDSGPICVRRGGGVETGMGQISGTPLSDSLPASGAREGKAKNSVERRSETAFVHFHFNAWAKYPDWQHDRAVPEIAARLLGKRLFNAEYRGRDFILEGGAIDVNGRGTLLTTEECLLDQKTQARNPGLGRKEIDSVLRRYLGATNVLWLGGGVAGDDTHGHVDDICRFVNPTTVVLAQESNAKDINYAPLAANRERLEGLCLEDGSKIQVVALPMPAPIFYDGYRLPASYANFYIGNAAVIVPTFNDPNDRVALGILGDLFPDRPVVGIHAVDLVLGFGTLHCLSQQQPA